MDMRMPPPEIQILLESNHLKSRILVRRLVVASPGGGGGTRARHRGAQAKRVLSPMGT